MRHRTHDATHGGRAPDGQARAVRGCTLLLFFLRLRQRRALFLFFIRTAETPRTEQVQTCLFTECILLFVFVALFGLAIS